MFGQVPNEFLDRNSLMSMAQNLMKPNSTKELVARFSSKVFPIMSEYDVTSAWYVSLNLIKRITNDGGDFPDSVQILNNFKFRTKIDTRLRSNNTSFC